MPSMKPERIQPPAAAMPSYVQIIMTRAHFEAIGRVAAEWAFLESMVEVGIWGLSDAKPHAQRNVTVDMRMLQRLKVLGALGHARFGPGGKRHLDKIISTISVLGGERNDYVHADWTRSGFPDRAIARRYKYTSKGPGKVKRVNMRLLELSPEKITDTADKIAAVSNDLVSLLKAHGAFPLP